MVSKNGSALGRLYVPTGLALETSRVILETQNPYAVNVAMGCENLCTYCYGSTAYKKKDWGNIRLAKDEIIQDFPKNLTKTHPEGVFLSFSTDPLLPVNILNTLHITKTLGDSKIKYAVLSKCADMSISEDGYHRMGKTIVSVDTLFWKTFEPKASPPLDRLDCLKYAEYPWISVEPYPPPSIYCQDTGVFLNAIANVHPKVIVFGKWNYDKRANTPEARVFYLDTVNKFRDFCKSNNIGLHIKSDTLKFVGMGTKEQEV